MVSTAATADPSPPGAIPKDPGAPGLDSPPGLLYPIPWGGLLRALLYGFLFGGGVLLVVPWWSPGLGLFLLGVAVGLLLPRVLWASPIAMGLGGWFFAISARLEPDLLDQRGRLLLTLLLPVAGVLLVRLLRHRLPVWPIALVVVAVLVAAFLAQAADEVPRLDKQLAEPRPGTYDFDPYFFIKTFYLVDQHGMGYYEAHGQANIDDHRWDAPITNLAGWRTPVLTRLWSAGFDSSHGITWAYIVLAALMLPLGWLLAARLADPAVALIVPALLVGYFLSALTILHFLAYEVWASFFAMAAAVLVTYRWDRVALPFALLAALIREWFVSALLAGLVQTLWRRRWRDAALWAGGLAVALGVYALNMSRARDYLLSMGLEPSAGSSGRLGQGGPLFILYTLQFNAARYAQTYVVPYLTFFLGLVGTAALLRRREFTVPVLILVPLAFFLLTGSGLKPGDRYGMDVYYSGAFLPFAMVAACCAGQAFQGTKRRYHRRGRTDRSAAPSTFV